MSRKGSINIKSDRVHVVGIDIFDIVLDKILKENKYALRVNHLSTLLFPLTHTDSKMSESPASVIVITATLCNLPHAVPSSTLFPSK